MTIRRLQDHNPLNYNLDLFLYNTRCRQRRYIRHVASRPNPHLNLDLVFHNA
jgi:hypothetical protein